MVVGAKCYVLALNQLSSSLLGLFLVWPAEPFCWALIDEFEEDFSSAALARCLTDQQESLESDETWIQRDIIANKVGRMV
uniref:Uncharacterized protein n=1 Tax=Anguilla anguilla TaxID=7936 RepID=A0A0E9TTY7_ANGAN